MLLDRFNKLFGHSEPVVETGNWLTDRQQIIQILHNAQRKRCLFEARIGNESGIYTTAVLGLNPRTGIMALDELTPEQGHRLFQQHKALHLTGRSEGVELEFDVSLIAERSQAGIAYYQVGIPRGMIYLQRRNDHRVSLTGAALFRGHRGLQNQQLLNGYAADLSLHGIGVVLKNLESLRRGDEMTTCVLQMPGQERIYFSLEVRFAQQIATRGTTRIGGRFLELGEREQNRLAKIIRKIERDHARYSPD